MCAGDEGIRIICEGLRQNKTVGAIDLPSNNITVRGRARVGACAPGCAQMCVS